MLYELEVLGISTEWFASKAAARSRRGELFKDLGRPGGVAAVAKLLPINRVTLTARLTPKTLALALLNGEGFVATREEAVV